MFRDSRYLLTLLTQCPFVVSTFRDILHVSLVGTGWNLKVIVFDIVPLAHRHVTCHQAFFFEREKPKSGLNTGKEVMIAG